jgi:GDPmannose 4,6-dehydratase
VKKALITGVTGQDGSLLARLLIKQGYEVHGIKRRSSSFNTGRVEDIYKDPHIPNQKFFLHYGDLTDTGSIYEAVRKIRPEEVYHLGAQSHVAVSFENPEYTTSVNALGTLRVLEALRSLNIEKCKFYNAASSEMFGNSPAPQSEKSIFQPESPYGTSKLFSYWITRNYRDAYSMHASNGILFNHESPVRGETFVTRKIVRGIVGILAGNQEKLYLGNLDAIRDWGFAGEYVELMWRILQLEIPIDVVVGTGRSASVRDFVEIVCRQLEIPLKWQGSGLSEVGLLRLGKDFQSAIEIDPEYFRANEVGNLLADASYANEVLSWKAKVSLEELIRKMIEAELKLKLM